jgi:hypothetical protein
VDALELFRRTAVAVPAYQDFLREQRINPDKVSTLADVPLMTKENYHTRYPLPMRCRNGRLEACDMIAVSSGSTGTQRTSRAVSSTVTRGGRYRQHRSCAYVQVPVAGKLGWQRREHRGETEPALVRHPAGGLVADGMDEL